MAEAEVTAATTGHGPSGDLRRAKYYFAYGSNLHMRQMQRRCPNSRYVGFGRLPNFRWQINERGFANVVRAEGHWVDGLVYEIEDTDEEKLDISEGVSKGAYEKQHMQVLVKLACCSLYRRSVPWIVARGGPCSVRKIAKHGHRKMITSIARETENVLVYISLVHVADSSPREEYIERINRGIRDAASLGMEDDYIRNCIRPFVPESSGSSNETPTPTRQNSPRTAENE
ncbi:AIG2 family protein [Pochonia chlamydosporia 170]|uniref:gamma-glutamylcyclotransferase n=1 Tax=Pochonia chlamydosporia 170 TaxID=1380566 RepID=A0A179FNE4_METCM|nr:AIG2 family protein [Pochonia chlamydosporia 170]OAQ67112.1 AIG2 family protein [Pochonia chlamydosporia 170]